MQATDRNTLENATYSTEDVTEITDLETLLSLLPACKRCRRAKRRCDTQLPACVNCSRVGADCVFFDHVSKEFLPRTYGPSEATLSWNVVADALRYIASLVDHLQALEGTQNNKADEREVAELQSTLTFDQQNFVHVRGALRYLGGQAPLGTPVNPASESPNGLRTRSSAPLVQIPWSMSVDGGMPQYLSDRYFATLHQVYPILNPELPFLTCPPRWGDASPFEAFTLNMVYSIACHCLPGNNTQLTLLSETFYREALAHADKVTAELNLEALQGVVLLALRSLFDSQEGSLGQQVAFAHRLEVELSAKEMDETSSALDTLRSAIYCIGSQMATGLDRPSGLAEPDHAHTSTGSLGRLCTLYRMQSRFRDGLPFDELDAALVLAAHTAEVTPLVMAAEKETAFLINPNAEAALQLLATYDQEDMIFNVFTPHWAYKAGVLLLAQGTDDSRLEGYMLASTVLERCALKWPNSRALQETLRALASPRKHQTSFAHSN